MRGGFRSGFGAGFSGGDSTAQIITATMDVSCITPCACPCCCTIPPICANASLTQGSVTISGSTCYCADGHGSLNGTYSFFSNSGYSWTWNGTASCWQDTGPPGDLSPISITATCSANVWTVCVTSYYSFNPPLPGFGTSGFGYKVDSNWKLTKSGKFTGNSCNVHLEDGLGNNCDVTVNFN